MRFQISRSETTSTSDTFPQSYLQNIDHVPYRNLSAGSEEVLFQHGSANRMIEILILLERVEG